MKPLVRVERNHGTVVLSGPFDFNIHREFRKATQELLENDFVQQIQLDFDQVSSIDNSGLGMLLLVKERCLSQNKSLLLIRCRDAVKQIFAGAAFSQLFTIR